MFTKLAVHNFRAIGPDPAQIDLAPLTILVGENGAGKSSFLEALALTAQSAVDDPGRQDLVADGPRLNLGISENAQLPRYADLHWAHDEQRPLDVRIEVDVPGPFVGRLSSATAPPGQMTWPPSRIGYGWRRVGKFPAAWTHRIEIDGRVAWEHEGDKLSATVRSLDSQGAPAERTAQRAIGRVLSRDIRAELMLAPHVAAAVGIVLDVLEEQLDGVSLLGAVRGVPLMHADTTESPPKSVGPYGEQTLRFLATAARGINPNAAEFEGWAKRFGMLDASPGTAGKDRLGLLFRDPVSRTPLDAREAAGGSRHALMLAAELILSDPGRTHLVEEPEMGMHPAFEKGLAALFTKSIELGHQIIASTHSEILVASIAQQVRAGCLPRDRVVVLHVERDSRGVHVRAIPIDDRGYLDGWVESFARVERELFDEWSDGLPQEG